MNVRKLWIVNAVLFGLILSNAGTAAALGGSGTNALAIAEESPPVTKFLWCPDEGADRSLPGIEALPDVLPAALDGAPVTPVKANCLLGVYLSDEGVSTALALRAHKLQLKKEGLSEVLSSYKQGMAAPAGGCGQLSVKEAKASVSAFLSSIHIAAHFEDQVAARAQYEGIVCNMENVYSIGMHLNAYRQEQKEGRLGLSCTYSMALGRLLKLMDYSWHDGDLEVFEVLTRRGRLVDAEIRRDLRDIYGPGKMSAEEWALWVLLSKVRLGDLTEKGFDYIGRLAEIRDAIVEYHTEAYSGVEAGVGEASH